MFTRARRLGSFRTVMWRLAGLFVAALVAPMPAAAQGEPTVGATARRGDGLECRARGTGSVVNACRDEQIPVSSDPYFRCGTRQCALGLVVSNELNPKMYYQVFDLMKGRWMISLCSAKQDEWRKCLRFQRDDEYRGEPGDRRRQLDRQVEFGRSVPQCAVLVWWRQDDQSKPYAFSQPFFLSLNDEDAAKVPSCRPLMR